MAISWGSAEGNLRVGIEVTMSPSSVSGSTSSVTLTVDYYVGSVSFGWNDDQQLNLTGSATGSFSYRMSSPSNSTTAIKVGTKKLTVGTSYSGTVSRTFGAVVSKAYNGATPSESVTFTIPRRPVSAPAAPTSATATRSSDSRMNISWGIKSTAGAPVTGVDIQRWSIATNSWSTQADLGAATSWVDTGTNANNRFQWRVRTTNASGSSAWAYTNYIATTPVTPTGAALSRASDTQMDISWSLSGRYTTRVLVERWSRSTNTWSQIASLGATATSYSDRGTTANDYYRYRVRAYNGLYSGYSTTLYASTTPAPPSAPVARRSGANINLTWTNPTAREISGIEVWVVTNGVIAGTRAALLTGAATSWQHSSPNPANTYAYRLKTQSGAGADDVSPNLYSALSAQSNTVQLLTNPLAPSALSPAGVPRDVSEPLTLTWRHNEVDGSDQTAYEIQYRAQGTTTWATTGKITSTVSSHEQDFSTALTNGQTLEWQVRTWGDYATAPAYSPWSASALVTLSSPPAAVIEYPADVVTDAQALVQWTYSDAEGNPQIWWQVTLYDGDMQEITQQSGEGDTSEVLLPARLFDDATYTVGLTVRDSTGTQSTQVLQSFSVDYLEPQPPTVSLEWDPSRGAVLVTIGNEGEGEEPPEEPPEEPITYAETLYNEVYRAFGAADQWVLIATDLPLGATVTDAIPPLGEEVRYRAVAVSGIPSTASSQIASVVTANTEFWAFLNFGPDFAEVRKIRDNVTLKAGVSRAKELKHFHGRARRVEFSGDAETRSYTLNGRVAPDSMTPAQAEDLALTPAPVCLRVWDRRVFTSVVSADTSDERVTREIALVLEEVDHSE